MSEDSIEVTYLWTEDEFVRLSESHRRHSTSLAVRLLVAAILALYALGGIALLFTGLLPVQVAGLLLCAFCLYLSLYGRRHALRRSFRRAGAGAEPGCKVTVAADAERVRKVTPGTDWSSSWGVITKVVESRDGFLVYVGGILFWVPHYAFADREDGERFARLCASRTRFTPYEGRS